VQHREPDGLSAFRQSTNGLASAVFLAILLPSIHGVLVKLNLRDLFPLSTGITGNIRRISLGAAIAVISAFGFAAAAPSTALANTAPATSTIVNRAEKGAKLVLQLPNSNTKLMAQHRSHSSHSSHGSHSSHRSHSSRTK
jgi:hypothetical protein